MLNISITGCNKHKGMIVTYDTNSCPVCKLEQELKIKDKEIKKLKESIDILVRGIFE